MVLGAKRGGHWFDSGGRCLTPRLTPKNSRMSNSRVHLCGFEVKDPFDKHRDDIGEFGIEVESPSTGTYVRGA